MTKKRQYKKCGTTAKEQMKQYKTPDKSFKKNKKRVAQPIKRLQAGKLVNNR